MSKSKFEIVEMLTRGPSLLFTFTFPSSLFVILIEVNIIQFTAFGHFEFRTFIAQKDSQKLASEEQARV